MAQGSSFRTVAAGIAVFVASITAQPALAADPPRPRNVAIVVYEGVELLDFSGSAEVFSAAHDTGPCFNVYLVAPTKGLVNTGQHVTLNVPYSFDDCPPPDLVLIPGGEIGSLDIPAAKDWIRRVNEHTEITMSVCNGAFVLADLGFLDGQDATTYWAFVSELRRDYPAARVHGDTRVCDNGKIVTTAGISAGIDGALQVVERLHGAEVAFQTARGMEYDWRPAPVPDSAPDHERRNLTRAAARAYSLRQWDDAVKSYRSLLDGQPGSIVYARRLGESYQGLGQNQEAIAALEQAVKLDDRDGLTRERLGRCRLGAGQNAQAAADYEQAIALGRQSPVTYYNLACALNKSDQASRALDALTTAMDRGWNDLSLLLADADLVSLHGEDRFRALVRDHARPGSLTIVAPDESGEKLTISGVVLDGQGNPVPGALLAVYQTDATGKYAPGDSSTKMSEPHSRLFGYLRTTPQGEFEVRTIRPGGYPWPRKLSGADRLIPAHVHIDTQMPDGSTLRRQMVFRDDPRMDDHWKAWAADGHNPVTDPQRRADGSWTCRVEIRPDTP